ncbi:unnamed protein product [Adineta steineri]|uniref:Uncharacterized protein n=1 Tax=Adineta steineri TaxID=433720 RepID=A0A814VAE5_9BILA|nr:unnamed protein product [Adineta steineri]CAF4064043.1 unnamed protein product [Adineta steineri]
MASNCTSDIQQIMLVLLSFILLISINTVDNFPVLDLSTDRNDLMENSTNSPSLNKQTDSYTFSQNNSTIIKNTSNEAFSKTTTMKGEISGGLSKAQQVKMDTPSTTYDSSSSSSSGLSAGAIAGIVCSVVFLVCAGGICAAWRKTGYSRNC